MKRKENFGGDANITFYHRGIFNQYSNETIFRLITNGNASVIFALIGDFAATSIFNIKKKFDGRADRASFLIQFHKGDPVSL